MKSTTTALPLIAALSVALAGCQGVHYANILTLAVTFGLFFGTLNLGRRPAATASSAERSATPAIRTK